MSSFNDKLKEIKLRELLIIIIISFSIIFYFDLNESIIYIIIILYVLFRTRHHLKSVKNDILNITEKIPFKSCLLLVITNTILAIGLGYISEFIINQYFPLDYLENETTVITTFTIMSPTLIYLIDCVDSIIIAPLSEELIFRGIILNRLNRKIPLILAILISSIIFGSLHEFEGCISATIFGICMCIVYLKTENILVPISLHTINNLISNTFDFIPYDPLLESDVGFGIIGLLSLISAIYIAKFIISQYNEVK